jgi:catechol-2,3-dioxygenase
MTSRREVAGYGVEIKERAPRACWERRGEEEVRYLTLATKMRTI